MATTPFFYQVFLDPITGNPASDGKLYVYVAGGSVKADIWGDQGLTVPIANPLTFSGAGACPQYWVNDNQALDYKAYTADSRTIVTALNVIAHGGGFSGIHNSLSGRDSADAHPIEAITGLTDAFLTVNNPTATGVLSAPVLNTSQVTDELGHTISVIEVYDVAIVPPGSPVTDRQWFLGVGSTGAWSGHDGQIARWDGSSYVFWAPLQYAFLRNRSGQIFQATGGGSTQGVVALGSIAGTDLSGTGNRPLVASAPGVIAAQSPATFLGTIGALPTASPTYTGTMTGQLLALTGVSQIGKGKSDTPELGSVLELLSAVNGPYGWGIQLGNSYSLDYWKKIGGTWLLTSRLDGNGTGVGYFSGGLSDTVAGSSYIRLADDVSSPTAGWTIQVGSSGDLAFWAFDGSTWVKKIQYFADGSAIFAGYGAIFASGTARTNSGAVTNATILPATYKGSATIPAKLMTTGKTFRISAVGEGAGSTGPTIRIMMGSTVIWGGNSFTGPPFNWKIEATISVISSGTSGSIWVSAILEWNGTRNESSTNVTTTINTTIDQTIDFQLTQASGGSFTTRQFLIEAFA